jgi:hypothetical protein
MSQIKAIFTISNDKKIERDQFEELKKIFMDAHRICYLGEHDKIIEGRIETYRLKNIENSFSYLYVFESVRTISICNNSIIEIWKQRLDDLELAIHRYTFTLTIDFEIISVHGVLPELIFDASFIEFIAPFKPQLGFQFYEP